MSDETTDAPTESKAETPAPPRVPSPAMMASLTHRGPATPGPAAPVVPTTDGARWGRVGDDGTVYVTDGDTERPVGSYPGAGPEAALEYFARKYDELAGHVELLHQRLTSTEVSAKDAGDALAALSETTTDPAVVGDLAALRSRMDELSGLVAARARDEEQARAQAKARANAEREAIVAEAEQIAAVPAEKVQWKSSSARMRALFDAWQDHQRTGPRLDKPDETALWRRFAQARNSFDKSRRTHFTELEGTREEARRAKTKLVAEAESLAGSTDWGPTARAFKQLMDSWRRAGRASRADDDALWQRFKTAQDTFFTRKDEANAAVDESYRANLVVKEELLSQAQAILPITDLAEAKAQLRSIQERWDEAGKVPRGDVDRVERALKRVEEAVRTADEGRWRRTNPEVAARAGSMAAQLEAQVADLEEALAAAQTSGDEASIAAARTALTTRQAWLDQARAGLAEFGG